jgi:hypothetical protein
MDTPGSICRQCGRHYIQWLHVRFFADVGNRVLGYVAGPAICFPPAVQKMAWSAIRNNWGFTKVQFLPEMAGRLVQVKIGSAMDHCLLCTLTDDGIFARSYRSMNGLGDDGNG